MSKTKSKPNPALDELIAHVKRQSDGIDELARQVRDLRTELTTAWEVIQSLDERLTEPLAQFMAGVDSAVRRQEPLEVLPEAPASAESQSIPPEPGPLPRRGRRVLAPLSIALALIIVGGLVTTSLALFGGRRPHATVASASVTLHHRAATPHAGKARPRPKARATKASIVPKSRSTLRTARTSSRISHHPARPVSHRRRIDHTRRSARPRPSLSESSKPAKQRAKRVPVVTCAAGCIATVRIKPGVFVAMTFRSHRAYTLFMRRRHLFVEMTNALPPPVPRSRKSARNVMGPEHPS